MSVSHFVSGSGVLLLGWLGVTFVREVPERPYPNLGRGSVPISARHHAPPANEMAAAVPASATDLAVQPPLQ
jgi:hypothetical protein